MSTGWTMRARLWSGNPDPPLLPHYIPSWHHHSAAEDEYSASRKQRTEIPTRSLHFHSTRPVSVSRQRSGIAAPWLYPQYSEAAVNVPNPSRRPKQRHPAQHRNFLQRSNSPKPAPDPFSPGTGYLGSSRGFHTAKQESERVTARRHSPTGLVTAQSETNRPENLPPGFRAAARGTAAASAAGSG